MKTYKKILNLIIALFVFSLEVEAMKQEKQKEEPKANVIEEESKTKELWRYVTERNLKNLARILKNVDVNVMNQEQYTPLILASEKGYGDVVDLLLSNGANPNLYGKNVYTALMASIIGKSPKITKQLLKAKADISVENISTGMTALMLAARNGLISIVEQLLKSGSDPNYQSKLTGNTALIYAVANDHIEIVRELLKAKANPNLTNKLGQHVYIIMADKLVHPTIRQMLTREGLSKFFTREELLGLTQWYALKLDPNLREFYTPEELKKRFTKEELKKIFYQ